MASLEKRTGSYNIVFRFGGRKFTRSLKTANRRDAESRRQRLEENIRLVESGRIEIPPDADLPAFLLSDARYVHCSSLCDYAEGKPSGGDQSRRRPPGEQKLVAKRLVPAFAPLGPAAGAAASGAGPRTDCPTSCVPRG